MQHKMLSGLKTKVQDLNLVSQNKTKNKKKLGFREKETDVCISVVS